MTKSQTGGQSPYVSLTKKITIEEIKIKKLFVWVKEKIRERRRKVNMESTSKKYFTTNKEKILISKNIFTLYNLIIYLSLLFFEIHLKMFFIL